MHLPLRFFRFGLPSENIVTKLKKLNYHFSDIDKKMGWHLRFWLMTK